MNKVFEINFDGLVGITHNYAGLSPDNVASVIHQGKVSHPKQAALQGLHKMKYLADLGVKQAILPPHPRPHWPSLKTHDLQALLKENPFLLSQACSSSFMWTANACTMTPSADSLNKKVHITPANLATEKHRCIEALLNYHIFQEIFQNTDYFKVHPPIETFPDEGAANHTRLCPQHHAMGLHLFAYGNPGRQSLQASEKIVNTHQIPEENVIFIEQNPDAIQKGVFHNDVICVGNTHTLFLHEYAFLDQKNVLNKICDQYNKRFNQNLTIIEVPNNTITLKEAIHTYLFNSQLITLLNNRSLLLAPSECQNSPTVAAYLKTAPFDEVHFIDVRESMQNGGGPACLRVRFILNEDEINALKGRIFLDDALYADLVNWVNKYYPEKLTLQDIVDESFIAQEKASRDTLYRILEINPNARSD